MHVNIYMPDYLPKYLAHFQHPKQPPPQYAPHLWKVPEYIQWLQMDPEQDSTSLLDKRRKKQSVVVRSVDPIYFSVNEIYQV